MISFDRFRPAQRAVAVATLGALALGLASGCVTRTRQLRSNALEYLYPASVPAQPAGDVRLKLPVRVGVAFAPARMPRAESFSEEQKRQLLERAAAAFRGRDGIAGVEVLPSSALTPGGGFAELGRLKQAYGIDLVALISYDQFQFSESTRASWTYWTLVGMYVVKGEKNETRTVLDTVVYDIPSRALLFSASGESRVDGSSTPVDVDRKLRTASERGFALAIDDLIPKVDTALAAFQKQAAMGTVRGAGTPGITITDESGGSAGAVGGLGWGLVALLAGAAAALARRPRD